MHNNGKITGFTHTTLPRKFYASNSTKRDLKTCKTYLLVNYKEISLEITFTLT